MFSSQPSHSSILVGRPVWASGENLSHATIALQLVHSDLCGPLPASIGKNIYFITFIDDYSRFCWVYLLKRRNAATVTEVFEKWLNLTQNESNQRLKALRTDGGGEYSCEIFQKELKTCGIEWQVTVPYTLQEDGVSENSNWVLVGHANAMVQHAGALKVYWAEALQTTVYLKNILLTKGTQGMDVTSYELWFGSKPDIKYLRV